MSNPTEGRCFHCHALTGECGHCPNNESSEDHEPDWLTLILASGEAFGPHTKQKGLVALQVRCKHCGGDGVISSSFLVKDIDWATI